MHVLVSAPSNAAVDEIVLRLSEGVWNAEGKIYKPIIVRVVCYSFIVCFLLLILFLFVVFILF